MFFDESDKDNFFEYFESIFEEKKKISGKKHCIILLSEEPITKMRCKKSAFDQWTLVSAKQEKNVSNAKDLKSKFEEKNIMGDIENYFSTNVYTPKKSITKMDTKKSAFDEWAAMSTKQENNALTIANWMLTALEWPYSIVSNVLRKISHD